MLRGILRVGRSVIRSAGWDLVPYRPFPRDFTGDEMRLCASVSDFTRTGLDNRIALLRAVEHIVHAQIPGDIAETGVWRGGGMMLAAQTLLRQQITDRSLYLYDTFEGMPPPTDKDVRLTGESAASILAATRPRTGTWCYADIADVSQNMASTKYPADRIIFVEGKVEETIPKTAPNQIALLRLDTDWYESTKHALEHLWPRLSLGGVLIIDDYGHWRGARQAVDEYFAALDRRPFLHRIDYTARLVLKDC